MSLETLDVSMLGCIFTRIIRAERGYKNMDHTNKMF